MGFALHPVAPNDSAGNIKIKARKSATSPLLSVQKRNNYTLG